MSPVKTVYEPRFALQRGSSQFDEPQPDQTKDETGSLSQCRGGKRGNKRARGEKTRFILKVKLPIFNVGTLSKKKATKDKTPGRWMLEPTANTTKTQMSQGGGTQGAGTVSGSVGGDVFFFSQRSNGKATNEKEKAKLAVLRTISKMLEENQLIRQRLIALRQVH